MRLIFILALIDTFIASIQSKRFDPIKQNLKISSKINYFKSEFSNRIDPDIAEEINLSTPQLITKYNYSAEVHFITTEDGYILQAHRIAGSPQSAPCVGKPPVFLLHGTHESSSTWIIMRPLSSLAYSLADQGFDVWLGNARGNVYSRNHTSLNPDGVREERKKFWNFSWHEIGVYDLPAMIEYILKTTGRSKLHYVGHSQGTTVFFVMCSERPEFNEKVISAHMLAPAVFLFPTPDKLYQIASPMVKILNDLANLFGVFELESSHKFYGVVAKKLCSNDFSDKYICELLLLARNPKISHLNETMLPIIFGHNHAGCATKQYIHYAQILQADRFQKFDYEKTENIIRYNSSIPPIYDLGKAKVKTILYYVENDGIVLGKNVRRLMHMLSNVMPYVVPTEHFDHGDYVWGVDAHNLIYSNLINFMKHPDDLVIIHQAHGIRRQSENQ